MGAANAVSFFFILSGLLTGFSAYNKDEKYSIKYFFTYMFKKIKEYYPLFFFTTMFTVIYSGIPILVANHDFVTLKIYVVELVKNLCLLQSWFPNNICMFNTVGWFLSTIMFLKVFNIPAILLLNKINRNKRKHIILSVLFCFLFLATVIWCYCLQNKDMNFWEYTFPPSRMGEYFMGMILGYSGQPILTRIKECKLNKMIFTFLEIFSLVIWIYNMYGTIEPWKLRIVHWLIPNFLVLYVFFAGKGAISAVFKRKLLITLGDISFECWLIHQIMIIVYSNMSGVNTVTKLGNLFSSVFCLGLTIGLSYLVSGKRFNREKLL